jgi:hypothetical protein
MINHVNINQNKKCSQINKNTQMEHPEIIFWIAQQKVSDTTDLESQVRSLESQVTNLETQVSNMKDDTSELGGAVLFCVGAFCALWAQNTGRNAWLWFFCGLLFAPITLIVLLIKNSSDRRLQK